MTEIWVLAPIVAAAGAVVLADANRVHLLQLGAETAWHLGVDVQRLQRVMFLAACALRRELSRLRASSGSWD